MIKLDFFLLIILFPRYYLNNTKSTQCLISSEFGAEFIIKSSSVITNLNVSHEEMRFKQNEDGREVRVTMDA